MKEISLNPAQAWNAMYIFLRNIWDTEGKKFEGPGTGLGAYLNFITYRFNDDYDWRREYVKTKRVPFSFNDKILPEDLFIIMTKVVSKYHSKYGFYLEPLLSLFKSMKDSSSLHQLEWKLWQDALEQALMGKESEWLEYCYYGNW
jgi:hypothetical protein